MKVIVYNEGEHPLRVIVDNDKINDSQIEAGATSGTRCVQGESNTTGKAGGLKL